MDPLLTDMHDPDWPDVPPVKVITPIAHGLWMGGVMEGCVLPIDVKYVFRLCDDSRGRYITHHPKPQVFDWPMEDGPYIPDAKVLDAIAYDVNRCAERATTLVHCHGGYNRSGLVVALALIRTGVSAHRAIEILRRKRSPLVLCNQNFEHYLRNVETADA